MPLRLEFSPTHDVLRGVAPEPPAGGTAGECALAAGLRVIYAQHIWLLDEVLAGFSDSDFRVYRGTVLLPLVDLLSVRAESTDATALEYDAIGSDIQGKCLFSDTPSAEENVDCVLGVDQAWRRIEEVCPGATGDVDEQAGEDPSSSSSNDDDDGESPWWWDDGELGHVSSESRRPYERSDSDSASDSSEYETASEGGSDTESEEELQAGDRRCEWAGAFREILGAHTHFEATLLKGPPPADTEALLEAAQRFNDQLLAPLMELLDRAGSEGPDAAEYRRLLRKVEAKCLFGQAPFPQGHQACVKRVWAVLAQIEELCPGAAGEAEKGSGTD